jgi:hypothetical protein
LLVGSELAVGGHRERQELVFLDAAASIDPHAVLL